jgi:opacity protein-like surface antigen
MKKLLLAAAILGISGTAFAADNGFYLGAQAGYANTGNTIAFSKSDLNNSGLFDSVKTHNDNDVFTGGAFLGFQFTPNFATQLGYTKFANTKSDFTATSGPVTVQGNATLKTQVVDLVGKVIYPVPCSVVGLYAKAGAAYVDMSADGNSNVSVPGYSPVQIANANDDTHAIRPEFGAGVSFDLSPNLVADVGYTYIDGGRQFANINGAAASIAYHFA